MLPPTNPAPYAAVLPTCSSGFAVPGGACTGARAWRRFPSISQSNVCSRAYTIAIASQVPSKTWFAEHFSPKSARFPMSEWTRTTSGVKRTMGSARNARKIFSRRKKTDAPKYIG